MINAKSHYIPSHENIMFIKTSSMHVGSSLSHFTQILLICLSRDQHQYKKATELLQKSLDIRAEFLGDNHPIVSLSMRDVKLIPILFTCVAAL